MSRFEAFALVGFNILLSPNNATGVSLSSDVDYKRIRLKYEGVC